MITLEEVRRIKPGDAIALKDLHTMEEMGPDGYNGVVTEVHHWPEDTLDTYGFVITPNPDISLMLTVRVLNNKTKIHDIRLMREWKSDTACAFDEGLIGESDKPGEDLTFIDFTTMVDEEESPYVVKRPYPIHGIDKSDGNQVDLCEYGLPEDMEVNEDWWAKNCLIEWYAYSNEDPMDGLVTMWMGWDCQESEFEVYPS